MECFECIEKRIEANKQREKIVCPYCGHLQDNDDYQYPVTCWGDDPAEEYECDDCEKKFFVKEYVDRYYEVGKEMDECGDIK
jgi:DNA-directed RNA polymerase subunit RPC12/RpoP